MTETISGILMVVVGVAVTVFLFGLAIFIHELGHFLAARFLGFYVDVFSIGFGPALWKKKVGDVTYKISAIPFGGYVSIPQLDPSGMEKIQGSEEKEPEKPEPAELGDMPPWKKIVVSLAGPFGNVVLAVLVACAIAWFAPPDSTGGDTSVGMVVEESDAWKAGLRSGDTILAVNDTAVHSWSDFGVETHLSGGSGKTVSVQVSRGNETLSFTVPVVVTRVGADEIWRIDGLLPRTQCLLSSVEPGAPAAQAGLQVNDALIAVNGVAIYTAEEAMKALAATPPFQVTVRRGGEEQIVGVMPRVLIIDGKETERPMIGVTLATEIIVRRPWMQERAVGAQLSYDTRSIFRVLRALLVPKQEGEAGRAVKSLGGPITIATSLYHEVKTDFWSGLGFLRLICINLAILNLLPIPVLDGGHILFALYALITRRRPNAKVVAVLVNGFAILLIGFMIYVLYRDAERLVKSNDAPVTESRAQGSEEPSETPLPLPEPEPAE